MSEAAHQNHTEKKAFLVNSSSLKEVRTFCREVFEKLHIQQDLKDELVLAIAEAAQNIVKHAFKNAADANELMVVQISCEKDKLQIAFYERGTPVDPKKVKHRATIKILNKAKKITKTPIVAIGGINSYNYKNLLLNNANFLAISSYIWNNKKYKPLKAIEKLK